jgi:hypothetical protein
MPLGGDIMIITTIRTITAIRSIPMAALAMPIV